MNANRAVESAVDSKPNGATVASAVPVATPAVAVANMPAQPTYEQLKAQLEALQALQATNGRPGDLPSKSPQKVL